MKTKLLIPIEVSEDGKYCGECEMTIQGVPSWCVQFAKAKAYLKRGDQYKRLPACLAAERRAKEEK